MLPAENLFTWLSPITVFYCGVLCAMNPACRAMGYIEVGGEYDHLCMLYSNVLDEPLSASTYSGTATPTYWDLQNCATPNPTASGTVLQKFLPTSSLTA